MELGRRDLMTKNLKRVECLVDLGHSERDSCRCSLRDFDGKELLGLGPFWNKKRENLSVKT